MNYEQDFERLQNVVGDVIKTGVTVGAQSLLLNRGIEPVKISIRAAKQDLEQVRQGLKEGDSVEKITKKVKESDVAKRIAKNGGNVDQYAGLILQKAELENAAEKMPSVAHKQVKTKLKGL